VQHAGRLLTNSLRSLARATRVGRFGCAPHLAAARGRRAPPYRPTDACSLHPSWFCAMGLAAGDSSPWCALDPDARHMPGCAVTACSRGVRSLCAVDACGCCVGLLRGVVACGRCVRLLRGVVACGCCVRSLRAVDACGRYVWPLRVAVACGRCVRPLRVAIACGHCVWPLRVAVACGRYVPRFEQ
jgi:hypothetical protein